MEETSIGLTSGVADSDLPLTARIAVAREGIAAIKHKLEVIAAEQADLADRLLRGEPVDKEIETQAQKLKSLRTQTERKHLIMAGYVASLERQLG